MHPSGLVESLMSAKQAKSNYQICPDWRAIQGSNICLLWVRSVEKLQIPPTLKRPPAMEAVSFSGIWDSDGIVEENTAHGD
jgi:hypothetical protein